MTNRPYSVIVTNQARIQNEVDAILKAQQDIIKAIDTNVDDPSAIAAGLLDNATKFQQLEQDIASKADTSTVTALNTIAVSNQAKLLELEGEIDTNTDSVATLQTTLDSKVTQAEIDAAVAPLASSDDVAAAVSGLASSTDIAHLASSNVPVALGTVPNPPAGLTPNPPTQGYIPVSDYTGKQAAQLVSLYAEGTDGKVTAELVTGPLDNGAIAVVDTILSSSASDVSTVAIGNPSNLMTVSSVRDASVFGTFKVLDQSGPGPVIVGSYDTTTNADSLYYQITADNAAAKGSVSETNSLDTSKEYDFELKTRRNSRQLYLREYGTEDYSKVLTDSSSGSAYNAAPFGFFANSNVVLRNLKTDTHIYSQIQSFNKVAPSVNPIVPTDLTGVTAIALRPSFGNSDFIELVQVPNDGTWDSAPPDLWAVMAWDAFGGFPQNAYTVFNYTDNTYSGVNHNPLNKIIALKPSNAIPTSVQAALTVISNNAASYDKPVVENIISGIQSGDVIYFEQVSDPTSYGFDPTTASYVIMWLINVASLEITRLEVYLQSATYDFTTLAKYGETTSVIETKFNSATDAIQLDKTISNDRIAKIGSSPELITDFSDFGTLPASGLA